MSPRASVRQWPPLSSERCRSTVITPAALFQVIVCSVPPTQRSAPFGDTIASTCESELGQPASWRVTDCEARLHASRSGTPSSLKSLTAIEAGLLPPVANVCGASNVPFPRPSRIDVELPVLLLATAMSGRPSWSQSAIAAVLGPVPALTLAPALYVPSGTPPLPFPRYTFTVLAPVLHTTRSAMPSPLK